MLINILKTSVEEINDFRKIFLAENDIQFVHNKCHDYGWADEYLFLINNQRGGYASIWGLNQRSDRDTIFEFYVSPPFEEYTTKLFNALQLTTDAIYMECQTNDRFTSPLFFEHANNIRVQSILFEDAYTTHIGMPDAIVTDVTDPGNALHELKYVVHTNQLEVASGGLLLNYNFPYADIYMDVPETFRGKGWGAFMVQELKRVAYAHGRIPAARCNVNNVISKSTLLRSGLSTCGYLLVGDLQKELKL